MARIKNNSDYNNPFAVRLRELIEEKDVKHREVAEHIGVTRQTVGQYADGTTLPTLDKLLKMADYFNVPLDYMAGTGKVKSKNSDITAACDYLGLSEKAVAAIKAEVDRLARFDSIIYDRIPDDNIDILEGFLCNTGTPLQTIVGIISDIRLSRGVTKVLSYGPLERYKDSGVAYSMAHSRLKIEEFNANNKLFALCNIAADKATCLLTAQELAKLENANTVEDVYKISKELSYYPLNAEIDFYYSALLEKAVLEEKELYSQSEV